MGHYFTRKKETPLIFCFAPASMETDEQSGSRVGIAPAILLLDCMVYGLAGSVGYAFHGGNECALCVLLHENPEYIGAGPPRHGQLFPLDNKKSTRLRACVVGDGAVKRYREVIAVVAQYRKGGIGKGIDGAAMHPAEPVQHIIAQAHVHPDSVMRQVVKLYAQAPGIAVMGKALAGDVKVFAHKNNPFCLRAMRLQDGP